MARETSVPAQVVREEIRGIEEYPSFGVTPGHVRVTVGHVDANGDFIVPQQFLVYTIEGEDYEKLVGRPAEWAPDKPMGTYRNEDLWHFVDAMHRHDLTLAPHQRKQK